MLRSKLTALAISTLLFSGCQIGYLIRTSYDHLSMLSTRVPIEKALQSTKLTPEQKAKLEIAVAAKKFAIERLGLHKSDNYSHFVQLDGAYVTYAVMASYKWKLEPFLWKFPITGKAPYKGYYSEKLALEEAEEMKKQDFDVYVRGVPAFSTLGWMNDPLLSSMLAYKEHDLVNTIIHELTHTTLFIKDNIDFNERLAVFVAGKGTEIFYLEKEGAESKTLKQIQDENADDKLFSAFITIELDQLKKWYQNFDSTKLIAAEDKEKIRGERFDLIRSHFNSDLKSKLKTKSYLRFASGEMNNARLGTYQTYMKNLSDFEKVYQKTGAQILPFLDKCKELNSVDDPEKQLHLWATE